MKKSDVYEHLAKIYLGNPQTKNKKKHHEFLKSIFGVPLKLSISLSAFLFIVIITIIVLSAKPPAIQDNESESIAIIDQKITKIDFNRSAPDKKGAISFQINGINFLNYKILGFSARKSNYHDQLLMRIELTDNLGRQSKVYISKLPAYKWQDFEIKLSEFKGLSDQSRINLLAFVAEEWEPEENKSALYIDNIHLLK